MTKIIFRLGTQVPLTENADVGEAFWDADRAALGVANGEQNPRFYPGINRDGSLKLNGNKIVSPSNDKSFMDWQGDNLRVVSNGVETFKVGPAVFNTTVPATFTSSVQGFGSAKFPGMEVNNGVIKFTNEVQFLGGINLSLASMAAGIIPTNFNNGDIFVAGSPHHWASPATVLGSSLFSRFLFDTENRENILLNFVEGRFFNKATNPANAAGSIDIKAYLDTITAGGGGYSRSTTARYTNKYGVRVVAPAYTPRLDYDPYTGEARGLLNEGPSTNILTETQINNWGIEGVNRTNPANASWTNKGITNPYVLTETNTNSAHDTAIVNVNMDETVTKSFSCYVEKDASSTRSACYLTLETTNQNNYFGSYFDLSTGVIGNPIQVGSGSLAKAHIEKISNTIYRIGISGIVNSGGSTATSLVTRVGIPFALNNSLSYLGTNGAGILRIADAQLENYYRPTSFMDAGFTRVGETIRIPGDQFGVDDNIGSLRVEFMTRTSYADMPIASIDSNVNGNYHRIKTNTGNVYQPSFRTAVNGSVVLTKDSNATFADKALCRLRYDYRTNSRFIFQSDTVIEYGEQYAANPTGLSFLRIGSDPTGVKFFDGWIQRVSYTSKVYTP